MKLFSTVLVDGRPGPTIFAPNLGAATFYADSQEAHPGLTVANEQLMGFVKADVALWAPTNLIG
jgi:hypothetical protein